MEGDTEVAQHRSRFGQEALTVDETQAVGGLAAEKNVLCDAEVWLELQFLVHRAYAQATGVHWAGDRYRQAGELDFARVRRLHAAQNLDECGFAGAILAHQGVHFAPMKIEAHAAERQNAWEALRNPLQLEQRLAHFTASPTAGADRRDACRRWAFCALAHRAM